jgi:hypothetical protein
VIVKRGRKTDVGRSVQGLADMEFFGEKSTDRTEKHGSIQINDTLIAFGKG